jgi:hypothetical protein
MHHKKWLLAWVFVLGFALLGTGCCSSSDYRSPSVPQTGDQQTLTGDVCLWVDRLHADVERLEGELEEVKKKVLQTTIIDGYRHEFEVAFSKLEAARAKHQKAVEACAALKQKTPEPK